MSNIIKIASFLKGGILQFTFLLSLCFSFTVLSQGTDTSIATFDDCYSSHIGGSGQDDDVQSVLVGSKLYQILSSYSTDYPVTDGSSNNGGTDFVLTCLDIYTGVIDWSTYIGGNEDEYNPILVEDGGKLYFVGFSSSTDFPVTDGSTLGSTSFVIGCVDGVTGLLDWSTSLDGGLLGLESFDIIATNGKVYFAGNTYSDMIPVTDGSIYSGGNDFVVACYDAATGNPDWMRYLGGSQSESNPLLTINNGTLILGGLSTSTDFPITDGTTNNGGFDLVFTQLDITDGSILNATFVGGSHNDEIDKIETIGNKTYFSGTIFNNIGTLPSEVINSTSTGYRSILLGCLDGSSWTFDWTTELGGSNIDISTRMEIVGNKMYSVGHSGSSNFPVTDGSTKAGGFDFVISCIDINTGLLDWATLCGGASNDLSPEITISNGKLYLVGYTNSDDIMVTDDSFYSGKGFSVFLEQIDLQSGMKCASSYLGSTEFSGPTEFNQNEYLREINIFSSGDKVHLNFPVNTSFPVTGDPSSGEIEIFYGTYQVVAVFDETNEIIPDTQMPCLNGTVIQLEGNRVEPSACMLPEYQWQESSVGPSGPWTDIPGAVTQNFTPFSSTSDKWYRRTMINPNSSECDGDIGEFISSSNAAFVMGSDNEAPIVMGEENKYTCPGISVVIGPDTVEDMITFEWDMGEFLSSTSMLNPIATVTEETIFTLTMTGSNGCMGIYQMVVFPYAADAGIDMAICPDGGVNAVQIGTPPIGGAPISYNWTAIPTSALSNLSCTACAQPAVTGLTSDAEYILTATITQDDGSTCETTDTVIVTPSMNPGDFPDVVRCLENPNRFEMGIPAIEDYWYTWAPGTYLERNDTSMVYFNSGSELPIPNPIGYNITSNIGDCRWVDTMTVYIITADADDDGCGPRSIGRDRHPDIPADYAWSVVSGPDMITGPIDEVVTTVGGSETETSVYELVTSFMGVVCRDTVVVPPCGCDVDICYDSESGCAISKNGGLELYVCNGIIEGVDPSTYEYTWSPCEGLDACTGDRVIVQDDISRTYTVTISSPDAPGFTCSESILVNDPAISIPVFNAEDKYVCNPGDEIEIGDIMVEGYSYQWGGAFGDFGLNNGNISNPILTFSPFFPDSVQYNVLVTDIGTGCFVSDTVTISKAVVIADAGPDEEFCGSAIISIGTPEPAGTDYTYDWSPVNSPWQDPTNENSAEPDVLVGTDLTFSVIVTDNISGCQAFDTMQVFEVSDQLMLGAPDVDLCPNDTVQIGEDPMVDATYNWTPAAGLTCANCAQPGATAPGTYIVAAQFPDGCMIARDTIEVSLLPETIFDLGEELVNCPAEGGVAIGDNAPDGMTSYEWLPDVDLTPNNMVQNPFANPSDTTDYVLVVTDENGCEFRDTVRVIPSIIANAGEEDSLLVCDFDPITLGNEGNMGTITWTSDPTAATNDLSCTDCAEPIFTPTDFGVYDFFLEIESGGCSAFDTIVIQINEGAPFTLEDIIDCPADRGPRINPTNIGECSGCTYSWTPSTGITPASGINPRFIGSSSEEYILKVTDPDGCMSSDTMLVIVLEEPEAGSFGGSLCIGDETTIGDPSNVGSITWTSDPADAIDDLSCTDCAEPIFTASGIGTFEFEIESTSEEGCVQTDNITINVGEVETPGFQQSVSACLGTCIDIGPEPEAGVSYAWSPTTGLSDPTEARQSICPTENINYTLTIIDNATGCFAEAQVFVTVVDVQGLASLMLMDYDACLGDTVTFTPDIMPATGNYSYNWMPSTGLNNPFVEQPELYTDVIGLGTFEYELNITDNDSGCSGIIDTATVIVDPCLDTCAIFQDDVMGICNNGGTPFDSSDDYVEFTLNPLGSVLGSGYTITTAVGTLSPTSASYGSSIDFTYTPSGNWGTTITLTIQDNETQNCSLDITLTLPDPCFEIPCSLSTPLVTVSCIDNNTPSDPSDDRFTYTLNVTGTGLGANYSVSGGDTQSGLSYDVNNISVNDFAISGGGFSLTLTDVADTNCTMDVDVTPPSTCSNDCRVDPIQDISAVCNNGGTPNDSSDDYVTFTLNVSGSGGGGRYNIASIGNGSFLPATGTFGSTISFQFTPIGTWGSTIPVTISTTGLEQSCQESFNLTLPEVCSIDCPTENCLGVTVTQN